MSTRQASLAALNSLSRRHAWGIDAVDWSLGVDRSRPWMPEAIAPLSFTPSFNALDARQRLRCNQLQALALIEKFIWFERMLMLVVGRLRRRPDLPPELSEALANLVEEEAKHVAMFQRLLRAAEPDWYALDAQRLFRVGAGRRGAVALAQAFPHLFLAWIWLLAFVEERASFLARAYLRDESGALDPLHRRVHELHLRDEARHCQLDTHLLACFYDSQSPWKKSMAGAMVGRLLATSQRAGAAAPHVVTQLGQEFPALRAIVVPRLLAELRVVHCDPRYRRELFGRAAMPRIHALLAEHPEHARAYRLLAGEGRP